MIEFNATDINKARRVKCGKISNAVIPNIPKNTKEMIDDEKCYERAVEEGIVRENPDGADYQLVEFEALSNEIKAAAENAIHTHNIRNAKDVAEELKQYLANREPVKRSIVLNDGMMGHEEKVRKDHVMESSVMMEEIRAQLAIIDDANALISKLEEVKPDPGADTFRNAVYTGVFDVAVNGKSLSEIDIAAVIRGKQNVSVDTVRIVMPENDRTFEWKNSERRGRLTLADVDLNEEPVPSFSMRFRVEYLWNRDGNEASVSARFVLDPDGIVRVRTDC